MLWMFRVLILSLLLLTHRDSVSQIIDKMAQLSFIGLKENACVLNKFDYCV